MKNNYLHFKIFSRLSPFAFQPLYRDSFYIFLPDNKYGIKFYHPFSLSDYFNYCLSLNIFCLVYKYDIYLLKNNSYVHYDKLSISIYNDFSYLKLDNFDFLLHCLVILKYFHPSHVLLVNVIMNFNVLRFNSLDQRTISLSPYLIIKNDSDILSSFDCIKLKYSSYMSSYNENTYNHSFSIKYSYIHKDRLIKKRSYSTFLKNYDILNDTSNNIFYKMKIPNYFNCYDYSSLNCISDNFFSFKDNDSFFCKQEIDGLISKKTFLHNDSVLKVIVDEIISTDPYILKRSDGYKHHFYSDTGILIKSSYETKSYCLKSLKKHQYSSLDLINTLDIECLNINNEFIPYAIGYYNGTKFTYFYGLDCIDLMLDYLLSLNNVGHIYVHNLNKFDFRFLIKPIINKKIKFNIIPGGDDKFGITSFSIEYYRKNVKKKNTIKFYDSLKLLPASLNKLVNTFNIPMEKGDFPYLFMNDVNKLNYIGEWPASIYFKNNLPDKKNPIWNAYTETVKYLKNDCVILYKILLSFIGEVSSEFNIKAVNSLTLPSMAMTIFRTNFLSEDIKIANLNNTVDKFIRNGYYGGIVDVYSPVLNNGYYYDINSLYPRAMVMDMPVGCPELQYGSIKLEDFFGFLTVKITAPQDLNIPFLPFKTDYGVINPLGSWTGIYFSEELKYAESLGYKITIIGKCYSFNRGKPFDCYINHFYEIKKNSKDVLLRNISKLMLNSLYGKFGMNVTNSKIMLLNSDDFLKYVDNKDYLVYDLLTINEDLALYNVSSMKNSDKKMFSNVAISAAITAYSRILIDPYKRIDGNKCFYSDTDSVFLQHPLDEYHIGKDLGQMKLESKIDKGIFISPKVYGYKSDGKTVVKVKGFDSNKISFEDLELLLNKNEEISYTNKTFKRDGIKIYITDQDKILKSTIENKRIPIYKDNI